MPSVPRPGTLVTIRNGYTSGTEDCPFWVEAMPAVPSSVIFPRRRCEHGRLGTGKGHGAGRRSLVKYNQPQGTPMFSFSVGAKHWRQRRGEA
jgi:hypothetical protein